MIYYNDININCNQNKSLISVGWLMMCMCVSSKHPLTTLWNNLIGTHILRVSEILVGCIAGVTLSSGFYNIPRLLATHPLLGCGVIKCDTRRVPFQTNTGQSPFSLKLPFDVAWSLKSTTDLSGSCLCVCVWKGASHSLTPQTIFIHSSIYTYTHKHNT